MARQYMHSDAHPLQQMSTADNLQVRNPIRLRKSAPALNPERKPMPSQLSQPNPHVTRPDRRSIAVLDEKLEPLPPPPPIKADTHARSASRDWSRPGTPTFNSRPNTPTVHVQEPSMIIPRVSSVDNIDKQKKKHWWNKSGRDDQDTRGPFAWVVGHPQKVAYDADALLNAHPMWDLWDDLKGNCWVYLFPQASGKGASFKVNSACFASSPALTKLAFGDAPNIRVSGERDRWKLPLHTPMQSLSLDEPSTPPRSPKRSVEIPNTIPSPASRGRKSNSLDRQEASLYLSIKFKSEATLVGNRAPREDDMAGMEDMQTLIDYRNLFAFLNGQPLVATEKRHSLFHIFMTMAGMLKAFQFTNIDSSTYGEVANSRFDKYVEDFGLADVRASREKTIEGVLLGEHMKSVLLFNEAFTHGVGKHEDITAVKSLKFDMISPIIQNRLNRAVMDLDKRTASIRLVLTDFEFPTLFSGIMNSKSSEERKRGVRFDAWKESFWGMRKFIMGTYKQKYGDWPPKAKSKKNNLETSGLNRLVLRDVYHDLSSMYDLLVDRTNLTTRTIDGVNHADRRDSPTIRGLRQVLSEYDRSSPPVKPPVPFDLPKLPTLKTTRSDFGTGSATNDARAAMKKLKDDEIARLLRASWNDDVAVTPFVEVFRDMEKRAAHGCTLAELEDLRIGQWIFMYVVLQALPLLACDAPGLKWTRGVEYFLCEPPRSGVPWADPSTVGAGAGASGRKWFSVGNDGGGLVNLPSDLVEHGVEGVYRRSHCWRMAEKWTAENPILNEALHEQQYQHSFGLMQEDDLPPPPSTTDLLRPSSRTSNRSGTGSNRNSSYDFGLEALPMPKGVTADGGVSSPVADSPRTPTHSVDAAKTFDAILAGVDKNATKKKR